MMVMMMMMMHVVDEYSCLIKSNINIKNIIKIIYLIITDQLAIISHLNSH